MTGRINDRELITLAPTNKKHTLQAMKRVMLRPESNNFALAVQPLPSRKNVFVPFWYKSPLRDYEIRSEKTLSLERLNYQNATDRVSVFRATSKLHAILNRGKKIVIYIIFSSWLWSSLLLIEIFFSPSRKVLNLRFCPVYITVTSSPSILEWAWHKRKVSSRIMGGLDLVSWTKLFFHVPKIYKIYTFCIFF